MILSAFLAQFAAGCLIIVGISDIRRSGWRYLRLMACVSMVLALGATIPLMSDGRGATLFLWPLGFLVVGIFLSAIWLFVNAAQQEAVTTSQRVWPMLAGLSCLTATLVLATFGDELSPSSTSVATAYLVKSSISTVLGAGLLGAVTAAMLLGHRYLTDTDMPITPLRRLAIIYLSVLSARVLWTALAGIPLWMGSIPLPRDATWFWLIVCVRLGVGLVMTSIFAAMAWDCVKRRATQSATAIFYLSMVFVFIGELAAQYLARRYGQAM
jgi:hypothetical protein